MQYMIKKTIHRMYIKMQLKYYSKNLGNVLSICSRKVFNITCDWKNTNQNHSVVLFPSNQNGPYLNDKK